MSESNPERLLVVVPNWVGDVVMATPTLRAIRQRRPDAHIVATMRPYVAPVLAACPWVDETTEFDSGIRRLNCDTALLLTNSFRSAWITRAGKIKRRIGYARDGRGWLLTHAVQPLKIRGAYVPVPAVDSYLRLLTELDIDATDRRVELFTREEDERWADALLTQLQPTGPVALLSPGAANKGDAKLWPAERYAVLADHLAEAHGATVLLNGSPNERSMLDAVAQAARCETVPLLDHGCDLHRVKAIAGRCDVVIANDSGARHIAVAMGAPTVSLFGPTDPEWTRLDMPNEHVVRSVDQTMGSITVEQVAAAADMMLGGQA